MNRFTTILSAIFLMLVFTTGCKEEKAPEKEVIRPVKVMKVSYFSDDLGKGYPAVTKADKETEISFRVGNAPIIKSNIIEGNKVTKGSLIAAIDPSDYEIALNSAKARYNQAKAEAERYERLWKKGSVSKSDYERKFASFKEAQSAYEKAKNNLKYTKVYAPFTGYYGPKLADIGDVIKPYQPITKLFDLSRIEVETTIPEQLAVNFRYFDKYKVVFDVYPDKVFDAVLKEMEKTPTPEGFKLHLYLKHENNAKSRYKISAGMSCRVNIIMGKEAGKGNDIIIPVAAVVESDTESVPSVWVVTKDLVVKREHVSLDGFSGRDYIKIKSGLKPGQTIVVAGAKRLVEGQKVTILDQKNFH
jgi:RND family efflux transporter MFP subunit